MVISAARFRWWSGAATREDRTLAGWLRLAGDEWVKGGGSESQRPPNIPEGPQVCRFDFRIAADRKMRWAAKAAQEYRSLSSWIRMAGDARASAASKLKRKAKLKPKGGRTPPQRR